MKRLDDKKNNSEFINLLLKDNFNNYELNFANRDIISYIKNNDKQEKRNLKIDKGIIIEIKKTNLIKQIEEVKKIVNNNDIINGKNINFRNRKIPFKKFNNIERITFNIK